MTTLQIDVLNAKATKLLEDLTALDLIAIRQDDNSGFQRIINKLRNHPDAETLPSLEEITQEVEAVRSGRYAEGHA